MHLNDNGNITRIVQNKIGHLPGSISAPNEKKIILTNRPKNIF